MQIRCLTFANRDWFSLLVSVWLKATTVISNKYSKNFILKKQKIIITTVMIIMIAIMIITTTKFFTEKMMSSAENWRCQKIPLNIILKIAQFLPSCTYDCEFQVNSLLRSSMNKSVSYFLFKKIWFMGEEITHKNDTRNTL